MKNNKCLFCYKEIQEGAEKPLQEYHSYCSKTFFGKPHPPILEYTQDEMILLAERVIKSQKTVTGVQPKLSLISKKMTGNSVVERLTIVGVWGGYILKPQTELYEKLPENEDLTMHLASLSNIKNSKSLSD